MKKRRIEIQLKTCSLFLGLLFSIFSYSQKIIISGQEVNRKLKWSDFTGNVDRGSSFNANTHYNYSYKIENVKVANGIVTSSDFIVTLELNAVKSWVKEGTETDELLQHEQGHFDLAILCVKEMITKYKKRNFTTSDFNESVKEIFKDTAQKYKDLQAQYDEETNHSKEKEQQLKWDTFIAKQLTLFP